MKLQDPTQICFEISCNIANLIQGSKFALMRISVLLDALGTILDHLDWPTFERE